MKPLPIITLLMLLFTSCYESSEQRLFPEELISCGDLAFRCGEGVFSRMVTINETDGVFSHIGVVVKHHEKWMVVHAVPGERESKEDFDRVKVEDLDIFFSSNRATRGCLVHPGSLDTTDANSICRNAVKAAIDSIRFDNNYDLNDSTEVYCTELIWRLFLQRGIDLSEGRRRHIHAFHINNDVLLPEHIFDYYGNHIYYSF